MKRTSRCPKCDHGEVLYVPEPKDSRQDRMAVGSIKSVWSGGVNGALEAYVCLGCGFVELHVASLGELELAKIPGATVQVAIPPAYR